MSEEVFTVIETKDSEEGLRPKGQLMIWLSIPLQSCTFLGIQLGLERFGNQTKVKVGTMGTSTTDSLSLLQPKSSALPWRFDQPYHDLLFCELS